MKLTEIQARIDTLTVEGQTALEAKNKEEFDAIQAKLKEAREELKAEIGYLADEQKSKEAEAQAKALEKGEGSNMKKLDVLGQAEIQAKLEGAEYKTAVLNDMMGKATKVDLDLINEVNALHSTDNGSILIPNTILGQIWNVVQESYPLFGHLSMTRVPGTITYQREESVTSTGDGWVTEDQEAKMLIFGFENFDLSGHEFHKGVETTFKMLEMSRTDFESYIIGRLAEIVGQTLSKAVYGGDGNGKGFGFYPRLKAMASDRIVNYTGVPAWTDITRVMGMFKSGVRGGLRIYANNATIWNTLANMRDENGLPLFIPDVIGSTGVGRILGIEVHESAELPDGTIAYANLAQGMRANINKDMSVLTELNNRRRIAFHSVYMILDFDLFHPDFFVVLENPTASFEAVKAPKKK